MAISLPAKPKIDRSRAGELSICFLSLREMLGLPGDIEIVGVSLQRQPDVLVIQLEGGNLPLWPIGRAAEEVTLIVRKERANGWEREFRSWAHARDQEWMAHEGPACRSIVTANRQSAKQ
jgi:hypothetical protein